MVNAKTKIKIKPTAKYLASFSAKVAVYPCLWSKYSCFSTAKKNNSLLLLTFGAFIYKTDVRFNLFKIAIYLRKTVSFALSSLICLVCENIKESSC